MRAKAIASLILWTTTLLLILVSVNLKSKIEEMKSANIEYQNKIKIMKRWVEEIKFYNQTKSREQNMLSIVESSARKLNIAIESARPVENSIEIIIRGIDPISLLNFLTELEKNVSIERIRIRKNFSDERLNDLEILIKQRTS